MTECEVEKNGYFQVNIFEENHRQSLLSFKYENFIYRHGPLRHCHTHNFSLSIQPEPSLCWQIKKKTPFVSRRIFGTMFGQLQFTNQIYTSH